MKIINFISKHKENIILIICLLFLVVRFYPTAGRFLDPDEEFYFGATSFLSNGAGLYTDLKFYYPPVLWYIGSIFFKIFSNLYYSMLAIRIFMITLSLVGFYLIFDIFKKMKLFWFIIPTTIFILYSMQFDLKLMEYRSDNALLFILILQAYLIFLFSYKKSFSPFKIILITLLGILTFHINHKAIFIEPLVMFVFLFRNFSQVKRFVVKYRITLLFIVLLGVIYLIFSNDYHRFFNQCYIRAANCYVRLPDLFPEFSSANKLEFITRSAKYNITFWPFGLTSFIGLLWHCRKDKKYLLPIALFLGAVALLCASIVPFFQYQLFLVWAILFSMPYFIGICCRVFPEKKRLIFLIIFFLSLTQIFTFKHYAFPSKSLKAYAQDIDDVQQVVGDSGLISMNGSSITVKSDLPFCDNSQQFRCYKEYCQSENVENVLKNKATKFVFFDQRESIKSELTNKDGYFIKSNYQKCRDLPLMISSKWIYLEPGRQIANSPIQGEYRVFLFTEKGNKVFIDGKELTDSQILKFQDGYVLETKKPAVLLIEYNTDKISSESLNSLDKNSLIFIPLNQVFADKFKLLGLIYYQKENRLFYRFFWKSLTNIDNDLMVFHHFTDESGNYITVVNIDPTDGWYDVKSLDKNEIITYDFSVDCNEQYEFINVGWYFEEDWDRRLEYNNSTFFQIPFKELEKYK